MAVKTGLFVVEMIGIKLALFILHGNAAVLNKANM